MNPGSNQNGSENGPLPIDDWVAWKPGEKRENHNLLRKQANKYTFEETLQLLEENIKELLNHEDFTSKATRSKLKFIQRQTCYSSDVILNQRITEKLVNYGVAHVYLKVWKSVTEIDYLKKENLLAFKNLQTAISIIWNCTDRSSKLCEKLVTFGIIQHFLAELSSETLSQQELPDADQLYLAKAYLGIMHNIVRSCSDSRQLFRSANAVDVLQKHFKSNHNLVKIKAYIILSYIINEKENAIINANDENIQFIVSILSEAVHSENHFSKTYSFWASEIVCGLNHLAVNDANKLKIAKLGALSLYTKLIEGDNLEEQTHAAAGLWILAFRDENKPLINEEPGCVEALRALVADTTCDGIRRAARGALWILSLAPSKPLPEPEPVKRDLPHVMLSYHWAEQKPMQRLGLRLKKAGYKVWMDIDNMSGSTLEAMALAVEQSSVILIGLSQGYKDSPSCRTEAEYAFRLHKEFIPLLLQPGYVPDGWIGCLVGTRLYFDLTTNENSDINMPRLLKEIDRRGNYDSNEASKDKSLTPSKRDDTLKRGLLSVSIAEASTTAGTTSPRTPRSNTTKSTTPRSGKSSHWEAEEGLCSLSSSTSSLHSYVRTPTPSQWTADDVKKWLIANQLHHVSEKFEEFAGETLLQYKKVMEQAPEYFYSSLERQLKLDLITALKFSKALDSLSS